MNEYSPYEQRLQQQLNDLLLPDENLAWADMKRRLEEDDDDGAIVWWRRGCLLWGFLLLVVLGGGWFLFKPQKWFDKKTEETKIENIKTEQDQTQTQVGDTSRVIKGSDFKQKNNKPLDQKPASVDSTAKVVTKNEINTTNQEKKEQTKKAKQSSKIKKIKQDKPSKTAGVADVNATSNTKDINDSNIVRDKPMDESKRAVADEPVKKTEPAQKADQDSIQQTKKADAVKKDDAEKKEDKKKNKNPSPLLFSTGIGLHQQLPIAGQKFTPYNSLGRNGSLADYIPSLYLKMEKEKKWFVQSEFRYGAPQYTKEFTYRQKSVPDSGSNPRYTTTTSSSLKKTFYHQLPFTFNYYIIPNWSIGTGLQWNKFKTAISEKTVTKHNNFTQIDSFVSKILQPVSKDSATEFAKSYFQLVLETQYQWKRFSIGGKYTFGLEPYIRFTLPGQAPQQQKNNAFQVFIRYQLWKQKKN